MKDIQKSRYFTQMAGEFNTAAELFRQGFFANVSFGNAKSFDIIVFSEREDKFARIEVKSSKDEYYTKKSLPNYIDDHKFHFNIEALSEEIKVAKSGSNKFYVFVALHGLDKKPDFYVFEADTIYKVMNEKIKSVTPDRVKGRWDIKLSEIFKEKKYEDEHKKIKNFGFDLIKRYLQ